MKKSITIIILTITCIFLGFMLLKKHDELAPNHTPVTVKSIVPELEPIKLNRKSKFYVKPEMIPLQFAGFYDLKQSERLNLATELMKDKSLPQETIDFFKAEIFNRAHMDTTRNNMANALCWQHKSDPELHKLFIKMLDDPDEDPVWRDYCIQFLTECYDSSNNKPLIIDTLKRYSKGDDSKAGTALIHLALHEEKIEKIDSDHMLNQLKNSKTSIHTRTAILAVWGKSNDKTKLPVIRKYAIQDKDAALKSVAIGSLGLIGLEQDLKIINKALYHDNGRVVSAARAAKTRIEIRIKNEIFMNKVIGVTEQIKKKKYPIAEPEIR